MSVIGLNEDYVNKIMADFNSDSANVLDELTTQFNNVLKALSDNWGTTDGKIHVNDKVVTAFSKTGEQVAQAIQEIGKTIKRTAEKQAADTNNAISISEPTLATLGALVSNMQDKLSNGFIGVFDTLEADVSRAQDRLGTEVVSKLEKLKNNAVNNCKAAFKDDASTVSAAADTYILEVKNIINNGFTQVKTDIDALTKDATQYARDIQAAGLRG